MKYRITFERPRAVKSNLSPELPGFDTVATVKAEKLKSFIKEEQKDGTRPQMVEQFRIRYFKGLDTSFRAVINGQKYNITYVDDVKYNREQIISLIKL